MEAYIVKHKNIKTRMDSRSGGHLLQFQMLF